MKYVLKYCIQGRDCQIKKYTISYICDKSKHYKNILKEKMYYDFFELLCDNNLRNIIYIGSSFQDNVPIEEIKRVNNDFVIYHQKLIASNLGISQEMLLRSNEEIKRRILKFKFGEGIMKTNLEDISLTYYELITTSLKYLIDNIDEEHLKFWDYSEDITVEECKKYYKLLYSYFVLNEMNEKVNLSPYYFNKLKILEDYLTDYRVDVYASIEKSTENWINNAYDEINKNIDCYEVLEQLKNFDLPEEDKKIYLIT